MLPVVRRPLEFDALDDENQQLRDALLEARAYVYNVSVEHRANWRGETAAGVLARIDLALDGTERQ